MNEVGVERVGLGEYSMVFIPPLPPVDRRSPAYFHASQHLVCLAQQC